MVDAKLGCPVSQTGPSSFFNFRTEEALKYYYAWDGSITSLVSSRPHVQPEEDPANEDAKDEGRSDREEKR
jgi:hypothetical protein